MSNTGTILIVDDHEPSRSALRRAVTGWGFGAVEAAGFGEAMRLLERYEIDLALLDYKLPDGDGLTLMNRIRQNKPNVAVIIITGHGDIEMAVQAVKSGAYDFLTKPIKLEVLEPLVRRAIKETPIPPRQNLVHATLSTTPTPAPRAEYDFEGMVGRSAPMRRLYSLIEKVAPTEVIVLLEGESGTGKELVADAIHNRSLRSNGPLIKLHCAALSEGVLESELFGHEKGAFTGAVKGRAGRFEAAHGGTLFLDEVSEIPLTTQVKLLRVMQEQRFERVGSTETIGVDVRVVAATNANLQKRVEEGRFRDDLYFRFKVITLRIPPLRERDGDVLLLSRHFLRYFSNRYHKPGLRFAPESAGIMVNYPWPGNVRELRNLIEAVTVLTDGDQIHPHDIIPHLDPSLVKETPELSVSEEEFGRYLTVAGSHQPEHQVEIDADEAALSGMPTDMERMEIEMIKRALNENNGNRTHAAKQLGIGLRTLQRKIKRYGLG